MGQGMGGRRALRTSDRREILVLECRDVARRIVWRTQLRGQVESLVKRCGAG